MLTFIRDMAAPERSATRDRVLGAALAFVAGAVNAGGFLAVGRYTSHMTGIVAGMADDLVLGRYSLVLTAAAALSAFLGGAMSTALLVNWARRRDLRSRYALPLLLEALLLLAFGLLGPVITSRAAVLLPLTVLLLCYLMGLQNAVITKISQAEIRTTHVTGLVTDIGIEIGRALYLNRSLTLAPVEANRDRLRVHLLLFGAFLAGSVSGAAGFKTFGYISTVPLALILLSVSWWPIVEDLNEQWQ